ncbi:MAG: YceI family protein [Myxococcota bacterium]|nr:YceI family protein [Myxococcota bacterium]
MSRFALTALLALALPVAARAADTYAIDQVHSALIFKAHHLGAAWVYGMFTELSGSIAYDAANPAASSIELTAKTDSLTTHNSQRDTHLKSPDFFNAKQFPKITFKSKSVTKVDDKTLSVTGDLTLHGVTKAVTAKVTHTGTGKDPTGAQIIGFETSFPVKRSDYGITYWIPQIDDEVQLIISLEGNKK